MLKTILVCLDQPKRADVLMQAAVMLARKYDAHLIGLHTLETLVVYPSVAMHIPDNAFASFKESQHAYLVEIKEVFDHHTKNEDFPSEWRTQGAAASSAANRIVESARAADLVIMAQEDPKIDRADQWHAPDKVIRRSGRPVLVIPPSYDGGDIGNNIVLGWSETREATRAAHDMLMIAQPGAQVAVLTVGPPSDDDMSDFGANELAQTLDRHGLQARIVHRTPYAEKVADVLNKEAFETGADLLVTGAFGHSRTYELVVGAATRALLSSAVLPVLYAK